MCFLRNVCTESFVANPGPFLHDPAVVVATAGGDGQPPKLVVHTHRSMVAYSKILMPLTDSPRPTYFLGHSLGTIRGHIALSLCNPVTRLKAVGLPLFSSVQGGVYALGQAHMRSTPSLRSLKRRKEVVAVVVFLLG